MDTQLYKITKLQNKVMKKILIILLLAICGISAKAQIVYDPFIPGQTRQQSQAQTVRTNAYYSDSNGNVYKLPIKVDIQNRYNMVSIYVSEYYQNNGAQGYWYKLPSKPKASECMSAYAQNPMEKRFMYKVMINAKYYYFDL